MSVAIARQVTTRGVVARRHPVAEVGTSGGGGTRCQHAAHAHTAAHTTHTTAHATLVRHAAIVALCLPWAVAATGAIGSVWQEIGRGVWRSSGLATAAKQPQQKPQPAAHYQRTDEQRTNAGARRHGRRRRGRHNRVVADGRRLSWLRQVRLDRLGSADAGSGPSRSGVGASNCTSLVFSGVRVGVGSQHQGV